MEVPTFQITDNELANLPSYLYKQEEILKEFGAIKIQLHDNCKLALKKQRKKLRTHEINKQIVKIKPTNFIYSVENCDEMNQPHQENLSPEDENVFWSQLSSLNKQQLNISFLSKKSLFNEKTSRIYFDIHRVPRQSVLKIAGKQVTDKFAPRIKRAHRAGAIFPLSSIHQHLFSLDYHHEGGNHHWYIVPNSQRKRFQTVIDCENSSICIDHQQIFVHPSLFEKNHIRYHRIKQCPNEFVILSSGTLFQSYTEDASWSESIDFALPSWITEGHGYNFNLLCKCPSPSSILIDMNLFPNYLIQNYIQSLPKFIPDKESNLLTDDTHMEISTNPTITSVKTNSLNDDTMRSTNVKALLSRQEIFSSYQSPSLLLTSSALSRHTPNNNQDNNVRIPHESSE